MERQYKIMWKDDFVSYLKDSPYFPLDKNAKTERPVISSKLRLYDHIVIFSISSRILN